jgi:dihydrodipicolinate synthase/N-acetylneuraminate lyase
MSAPARVRYPRANLAACLLPWTNDHRFDQPRFEAHVAATLEHGYTHLYTTGTAGEGYALSDAQFKQVVTAFAALTVRPGIHPQVGIISTSLSEMIARISWARERGIRVFQITLPCWAPLDEGERMTFFTTLCGRFPDCSFLHYNLLRARHVVTGAEYRRIAAEVPNLVATKNGTGDAVRVAELMTNSAMLQHFLTESGYAHGCLLGECSLLCSFAGLFPRTTHAFFEAGRRGQLAALWRLHVQLNGVERVLFSHCGRDMVDGAYDKAILWLSDPRFPYRLLPPYQGLTAAEASRCRAAFRRAFAGMN